LTSNAITAQVQYSVMHCASTGCAGRNGRAAHGGHGTIQASSSDAGPRHCSWRFAVRFEASSGTACASACSRRWDRHGALDGSVHDTDRSIPVQSPWPNHPFEPNGHVHDACYCVHRCALQAAARGLLGSHVRVRLRASVSQKVHLQTMSSLFPPPDPLPTNRL
jgi:hypothetical protein